MRPAYSTIALSGRALFRGGHLLFFTNDGSLFCQDLQRDGRYALHCRVEDQEGGEGEFFVRGQATLTDDPDLWVLAEKYVPLF